MKLHKINIRNRIYQLINTDILNPIYKKVYVKVEKNILEKTNAWTRKDIKEEIYDPIKYEENEVNSFQRVLENVLI